MEKTVINQVNIMNNNYNWQTEFDTVKEQVTHSFSNDVKVITDFKFRKVRLTKSGDVIDSFPLDEISGVEKYEKFLLSISSQAEENFSTLI